MSTKARILVVDDTPHNAKLLADVLEVKGFAVETARSGAEAFEALERQRPDLVLLDVVMPEISGYEVCRRIREHPDTRLLPVVLVSALDPDEERIKGIEAGADDFLTKPIHQAELLARVHSLLRIKELHETVERQARELAAHSQQLEQRVKEQVEALERLGRLQRFLAPQVARSILDSGSEDALRSHRRPVAVVFLDLRGFTPFAETQEPEEVMGVLGEFHARMGHLVMQHEGTLERFTGDGMMVFFNDPIEIPNPEERAVRMAVAMRSASAELSESWHKRGHELALAVGISAGFATLGAIGFEGRWDYAAIGTVTNLAARLCDQAPGGHILVSHRVHSAVEGVVRSEPFGKLELRGIARPVVTHSILGLRSA